MNLKNQPLLNNTAHSLWQNLYVLTEHWQSDLQFYKDEIRFFRRLVEKKLLWLEMDKNIKAVRSISNRLLTSDTDVLKLEELLVAHLRHFEELYESPLAHDEWTIREEHSLLEDQLTRFVKSFRELKKEVFSLVEHVIETEAAQPL